MSDEKSSFFIKALSSMFMDRRIVEGTNFLGEVPLFSELDRRQRGKIFHSLIERDYDAADEIFAEGDIGKALFIIRKGEIEIFKVKPDGEEMTLVKLGPGAYFGELALLDELPRSAGARTVEPSEMLILYKANFDGLIRKDPSIGLPVITQISKNMSGQIRRMNDQVANLLQQQKNLSDERAEAKKDNSEDAGEQ